MITGFRAKNILFLFFLFPYPSLYGQINDIGFGLGGFNFTGDLSRDYKVTNQRPAATVFFRNNLSDAIGLRYGITAGWLEGSAQVGDTLLPGKYESFNISLLEASAVMEYHFLEYKSKHSRIHWTPFLFFGAGLFTFFGDINKSAEYSRIQPMIPLGFGFKYNINPKFDLGFEACTRITFFDYLDKVSGTGADMDYDYGNKYDFDSYYFVGFTLYYTFYIIPCPYGYD